MCKEDTIMFITEKPYQGKNISEYILKALKINSIKQVKPQIDFKKHAKIIHILIIVYFLK